jgi:predicted SAM-dependent methyltransferase
VNRCLLHVGCGPKTAVGTTRGFADGSWSELRLDIDPAVRPDIVGSMTDMSRIGSGSVHAIYSSHNIEHLYPHEVPVALAEFIRVLSDDGFCVVTCPDLRSVCRLVADDQLLQPAYQSAAGPITPLDTLYGHRASMARGQLFMAHRCGFTEKVLRATLKASGFRSIASLARPRFLDLWAVASKRSLPPHELRELALQYLPAHPREDLQLQSPTEQGVTGP